MIKHSGLYILVFLLLTTGGCNQKSATENPRGILENSTIIRGKLLNGAGEEVLLEEMGAREYIPVDTVLCDDSGKFNISFLQDQIAFYVLRYGPAGYITLLLEPGESIDLNGQLEDKNSYTIKGSPGSTLLQILAAEHKKALEALGDIARKNRELVSSPDYTNLKQQLDLQFDSITSAFQDYSIRFIHENPGSPAILIALYNLYGQGIPVFHPRIDFPAYGFVDSVMMASHSELEAVQLLHAQVTEAKMLMESGQQAKTLKKGEIAPDFVSSRPDGSKMALSSLKGNYVLLGFWASWSNLSREENAVLKKASERFGDMNFRILQVSVDDNLNAWTGAIDADGLNWDHVSDLNRWETPVVDLYGVEKIPFMVIIDPAGKIVETALYGDELIGKLDQLLNN
ncbi:MAG: TlpA disulfide reductase family protein [Bacteroidota bacterium]|nr:TlpA disulfide reductase family protein [Bacteroidota bacterium]